MAVELQRLSGAAILVLAAVVANSPLAGSEERGVGLPAAPAAPAGTPAVAAPDDKSEPTVVRPPSSALSTDLLRVFVDTAAQVHASSAADLQRKLEKLLPDLGSPAAQADALQVANDTQRSILDAFTRKEAPRQEQSQPATKAHSEHWWNVFFAPEIAVLLSVLSLITSLGTFVVLRSATRRALRDAGLL